jgi:hypothetical protein
VNLGAARYQTPGKQKTPPLKAPVGIELFEYDCNAQLSANG